MAYSEKVLDHYENPRNVGKFDPKENNIGTGMVGAPSCGDVMRLQIKVEDNIIKDAKFGLSYFWGHRTLLMKDVRDIFHRQPQFQSG